MALRDILAELTDSIAVKTSELNNLTEKIANKKQDLTSTNPAHFPSVPAVTAGLEQAVKDSNQYTDNSVSTLGERFGDYIPLSQKGVAGGVAETGADNKILSTHLPSYVDDVVEAATASDLPETGESGKIYVTLDDNKTFRWSGTTYAEISPSIALGETADTAYRGDRGKIAYDHTGRRDNPHGVTKNQVGLGNVDNTSDMDKPVSNAQAQAIGEVADELQAYKEEVGEDFPDYNLQYLNGINYGSL